MQTRCGFIGLLMRKENAKKSIFSIFSQIQTLSARHWPPPPTPLTYLSAHFEFDGFFRKDLQNSPFSFLAFWSPTLPLVGPTVPKTFRNYRHVLHPSLLTSQKNTANSFFCASNSFILKLIIHASCDICLVLMPSEQVGY